MNKKILAFLLFAWLSIITIIYVIYQVKTNHLDISYYMYYLEFYFYEYYYFSFIAILFLALLIWIQHKYYKNTLEAGANCQIQFLRLEEIAHSWLDENEIRENMKHSLTNELTEHENKLMNDLSQIVGLFLEKNIKNTQIVNDLITPNLHMFTEQEIRIILTLLELLEKNSKVASVGSIYKEDTETKAFKRADVTQTETKYQVLQQFTLLEHSLNVVKFTIENLKNDHFDNFVFLLPKAIIVALAHDIGKIVNINVLKGIDNLDEVIYSKVPHEKISKMIMNKLFSDYEYIDEINEAIEEHHIANAETTFGVLLKKSDHDARSFEIKQFLKKSQQKNEEETIIDSSTEALRNQINDLIKEKRLIEEKSKKDTLTRAYNRAAFNDNMKKLYDTKKNKYHIAFVDADHFKNVNDTYGHQAGDKVLIALVDYMYEVLRKMKLDAEVFRYGGEEFCIVFENIDDNTVLGSLEQIRIKIESTPVKHENIDIKLTASIGVASTDDSKVLSDVLKLSDECVYTAKKTGRNKVVSYIRKNQKETKINDLPGAPQGKQLDNLFDESDIIKPDEVKTTAPVKKEVNKTDEPQVTELVIEEEVKKLRYSDDQMGLLCEDIIKNVNKVHTQSASKRKKILTVSLGTDIYIEDATLKKMLKKFEFEIKTEDDLNQFFEELKRQTLLKRKSVNLSFENLSNASNQFKVEFHCFDGESLGLNARDLDLQKREDPDLRNVNIIIRNKNEQQ